MLSTGDTEENKFPPTLTTSLVEKTEGTKNCHKARSHAKFCYNSKDHISYCVTQGGLKYAG